MNLFKASMLTAAILSCNVAWAEEPDLDEIVRNPVIGNYKGYAEFKMGNYETARVIWEALAKRGNGEANFNLGVVHEDGLSVPANMETALAHYERAAEAGNSKAQYRLGLLYAAGVKVAKDEAKADKWLNAAAASGDSDAKARLALLGSTTKTQRDQDFLDADSLHASGKYEEAAAIWKRLAHEGDTRSRSRLAWMHEAGQGMPRDLDQAAKLFRQSAEEGDADAQYAIAVMLQTGKGQAMNPAEAEVWLRRAAAQGHQSAGDAVRKLESARVQ